MAIQSKNMPKKRLQAIANRPVREKTTKGRAGKRWESVVERGWKDVGGNQGDAVHGKRGGTLKR